MANELVIGEEYITSQLGGIGAPAGEWSGVVPPDAPSGIAIVWQLQSPGVDSMLNDRQRIMAAPLYLVYATGAVPDFGSLQTWADAIDTQLHRQEITVNGHDVVSYRESPFSDLHTEGSVQIRRLGGMYRLEIQ